MPDKREIWIQLFCAAVTGVAAGGSHPTEVGTAQRAGKIADAALKELDNRDNDKNYQALFAGGR